jgi:tetratricopeptide (TPR) repeat protein
MRTTVGGRWAAALAVMLGATEAMAQRPRLPFPMRGASADPTPAEREYTAGEVLLRAGDLAGAEAHFVIARGLDPRDARPVFYLGEVARARSQWPVAEARYGEALGLDPAMVEAMVQRAVALRELGRPQDAVPWLRRALQRAPMLGEAQLDLGLCLEDVGDIPGAIVAFRAASARLHSDARAPLSLGLLLSDPARGASPADRTEAIGVLREAIRRAPSDAAVLGLAGPALRRLGEGRLAVDALQRAVQLTPTAALRIELAQALWAAGDRPRAVREATLASGQAPGDLSARYVLALMLAEQGDVPAAAAALRAVIAGTSDPALRARATAALRRVAPR